MRAILGGGKLLGATLTSNLRRESSGLTPDNSGLPPLPARWWQNWMLSNFGSKQASPFNMNNSGDPVQSVIQECPTAPQSLRDRRTIVTRREGRIKILSTRTHPFGMSMAVSEFSNGVSNLHFPVSKAEDNYKLFCHKYWCSGAGHP